MVAASIPLLEARGITKRFPGCLALAGVNLSVRAGEVLALIGENGAGKSTLMKILAGVQQADSGELLWEGTPRVFANVEQSLACGVALIHQELNLADNLSIGANIYLGREPARCGIIDQRKIRIQSIHWLAQVGLKFSPETPVSKLSVGQQQLVEIAKALSTGARVIIMDEPTSSLSQHETHNLFGVIRQLKSQGVSVIYISHRLGEVSELADRVLVFRDGANAGELRGDEATHSAMVRLMVGRNLAHLAAPTAPPDGPAVLKVTNVATQRFPHRHVSFELRRGEIVGIAGLVGAGRTELVETLFGIRPSLGGSMLVGGHEGLPASPREAISCGLALVPEDRKTQGLVLTWPVAENIGLAGLFRNAMTGGRYNRRKELSDATAAVTSLRIKTPGTGQVVQFLSGGNQQKVVLAKWLALTPQVLLLDEPTRGIDLGAKQEIYELMRKLAAEGMGILFVSSEMEEILRMANRVLVMREGALTGELGHDEMSEEAIMRLATQTLA